jgi:probable rRNA maturation factor
MDELIPDSPDPGIVGDIVLCPQFAQAQAKKGLEAELHLLTIHGILHCLGYDHADPDEEKVMFELQETILAKWQAR